MSIIKVQTPASPDTTYYYDSPNGECNINNLLYYEYKRYGSSQKHLYHKGTRYQSDVENNQNYSVQYYNSSGKMTHEYSYQSKESKLLNRILYYDKSYVVKEYYDPSTGFLTSQNKFKSDTDNVEYRYNNGILTHISIRSGCDAEYYHTTFKFKDYKLEEYRNTFTSTEMVYDNDTEYEEKFQVTTMFNAQGFHILIDDNDEEYYLTEIIDFIPTEENLEVFEMFRFGASIPNKFIDEYFIVPDYYHKYFNPKDLLV